MVAGASGQGSHGSLTHRWSGDNGQWRVVSAAEEPTIGHYLFNFSRKGAAKGRTLQEQAAELLQVKLWGIGSKTPNRGSLAAGDRVLIYVGAPEYAFIGHAELASSTHEWAPEEASRYPGSFEGGVVLTSAEVWPHPVPMKTALPQLELKETNPGAHFFSGVVRITQRDYETVAATGTGVALRPTPEATEDPESPPVSAPLLAPTDGRPIDVGLLFKTAEKLSNAGRLSGSLSEYDTRAEFIDKYLEALGYTELGDIQRGSPVESGNFPDYVLRVNDQTAIAIEAKKLGAELGRKEAAQVVAYCSNLGVRWVPSPTGATSSSMTHPSWAFRRRSGSSSRST